MGFLLVFFGAGIGGSFRHLVNLASGRWFGPGFPTGTLLVNVAGSFMMGLLAGYFAARPGSSQDLRLFLTTGVLGGFTTFSAFSLDTALLIERHAYLLAGAYVLGSVVAAIIALFIGLALFRAAPQ